MKKGIHPEYVAAKIMCACGHVLETRATKPIIRIEICSQCHPLFTGKKKLVDTAGRVERFLKKYQKATAPSAAKSQATAKVTPPPVVKPDTKATSKISKPT